MHDENTKPDETIGLSFSSPFSFLIYSRIEQRIEQEFVSAVGLSAELTADADKNDVSFLVLHIYDCSFARNHIFSQEPSAQKDVFFGVAGYDFSIPFP